MVSEREAGSRESPEPVLIAEPASDTSLLFVLDPDGHGPFRDMCLAYGDFCRPIFLETIRDWFIRNANKTELAELRKAISARSANLGKGGRRGRPRAKDDHNWLIRKNRRVEAPDRPLDMASNRGIGGDETQPQKHQGS